eukprot:5971707-Prymnesium_polylepis.1
MWACLRSCGRLERGARERVWRCAGHVYGRRHRCACVRHTGRLGLSRVEEQQVAVRRLLFTQHRADAVRMTDAVGGEEADQEDGVQRALHVRQRHPVLARAPHTRTTTLTRRDACPPVWEAARTQAHHCLHSLEACLAPCASDPRAMPRILGRGCDAEYHVRYRRAAGVACARGCTRRRCRARKEWTWCGAVSRNQGRGIHFARGHSRCRARSVLPLEQHIVRHQSDCWRDAGVRRPRCAVLQCVLGLRDRGGSRVVRRLRKQGGYARDRGIQDV